MSTRTRIGGRRSSSITPAMSRTTSSISTPRSRLTRCGRAISRQARSRRSIRSGSRSPASNPGRPRSDPSAAGLLPSASAPNLVPWPELTSRDGADLVGGDQPSRHESSPTVAQGRGVRGAGGSGGRGRWRQVWHGRGGGSRGTSIILSGQLHTQRGTDTQALNVFPNLGGDTTTKSVTAPLTLTVARNRSVQFFTFNASHSSIRNDQRVHQHTERRGPRRHSVSRHGVDRSAQLGRAESVVLGIHRRSRRFGERATRHAPHRRLRVAAPDRASSFQSRRRRPAGSIRKRHQRERARHVHVHRAVFVGRRAGARTDRR